MIVYILNASGVFGSDLAHDTFTSQGGFKTEEKARQYAIRFAREIAKMYPGSPHRDVANLEGATDEQPLADFGYRMDIFESRWNFENGDCEEFDVTIEEVEITHGQE